MNERRLCGNRSTRWGRLAVLGAFVGAIGQPAQEVPAWRALLGRVAVEVRVREGVVHVALASDSGEVALVLQPGDLRRFADSASRVLAAPRRPRLPEVTLRVEEAGQRSGALVLTRMNGGVRLFAADDLVGGVRDNLTVSEARLLVRRLRAAAMAAAPERRKP